MALLGKTPYQIKIILSDEKIPTRAMIKGKVDHRIHATSSNIGIWNQKTIKGILTNQLYTGDMVQNRRSKVNYKIKKTVNNCKEDWIIVENTHTPLVSKEEFEIVQKLLPKNTIRKEKKIYRRLDGLLYCHECGHRLGICNPRKSDGRTYIVCNYYRMNSKYNVCTSHGFNYDYLEEVVINTIRQMIQTYLDKTELLNQVKEMKFDNPFNEYKEKIKKLENKIQIEISNLDKVYMDKIEKKISEDMYQRIYEKMSQEIDTLKKNITEKKNNLKEIEEHQKIKINYKELLEEFESTKKPSREMLLRLIDKIEVHADKQLDIYFNFKELNHF